MNSGFHILDHSPTSGTFASVQVMEQGVQQGWGYTGPTVYVGLAGIALVYFRLHEAVLASSNDESSAEARRQSRAYLDRALDLINFVRPSPVSTNSHTPYVHHKNGIINKTL